MLVDLNLMLVRSYYPLSWSIVANSTHSKIHFRSQHLIDFARASILRACALIHTFMRMRACVFHCLTISSTTLQMLCGIQHAIVLNVFYHSHPLKHPGAFCASTALACTCRAVQFFYTLETCNTISALSLCEKIDVRREHCTLRSSVSSVHTANGARPGKRAESCGGTIENGT